MKASKSQAKPDCPDIFTIVFARQLIAYLGGDAGKIEDDWCWHTFAINYPELKGKAEQYFAEATTGDPSLAAYMMVEYGGSERDWAEGIIERATTGNPAWAARLMVECGGSERSWGDRIEKRIS